MTRQVVYILNILIVVTFGLIPGACKKYPENTLWFKNPEKAFQGGKITSFKVDGADSIPLLNSAWGYNITEKSFVLIKPYHDNEEYTISGDFNGTFLFQKKEIGLYLEPNITTSGQTAPSYNPFIMQAKTEGKTNTHWDIIKLTKKGFLKLKKKVNGKTYELEFN